MTPAALRTLGPSALALVLVSACSSIPIESPVPLPPSAVAVTDGPPTSPHVTSDAPVSATAVAGVPASRRPSEAPRATLVTGRERVVGEVGSFTFGPHTESAPWLPAGALQPVPAARGAGIRVDLDREATVGSWTARIAASSDPTADRVAGLGSGLSAPIHFGGPSVGDWVVAVTIQYAGGLGDGAYYWRLVVQ